MNGSYSSTQASKARLQQQPCRVVNRQQQQSSGSRDFQSKSQFRSAPELGRDEGDQGFEKNYQLASGERSSQIA